jgi:hypothetical protein
MENKKNKSEKAIDQLRNEAVKGEEIKGGNGTVIGAPNPFGPHNLPTDPLDATNQPYPDMAINNPVLGELDPHIAINGPMEGDIDFIKPGEF